MIGSREGGNETYILNLIRSLRDLDMNNAYYIYTTNPAHLPPDLATQENLKITHIRPGSEFLRIPFVMPYAAWRQGADLLHVTYNAPPWCPCPIVVTVHDISYELFPDSFSPRDRLVLSTLVPFSLRRAAKVITGSEHTKRDMVGRYGLPEEKVVVTYYAADHAFRPILDSQRIAATKAKYGITTNFILFLGSLQPRKNLLRLIEAFARLREGGALAHKLVIAGQALWRESEVYNRVRKYGLEEEVVFTDYVPHEDLPPLYNAADLFVFPSLYEGFGLPPLEAMACGTPVVASNTSSLREVLGDAAILVDPYDVQQLARAMRDVLSSGDLRREMAAKGLKGVRRFSWAETARKTLEVYQEVCSSKQHKLGDLNRR